MPWVDIQQNTDEWLDLRIGKVTGSAIAKVMANYGKAFGDPAKRLAMSIAYEQITGTREEESGFSNGHMDRGHIQEPLARAEYEAENFVEVSNGGFYDDGMLGSSPDGLVYDNGVIEIKSVIRTAHGKVVRSGTYDKTYKWQLFFNLKVSGREWIDFISYCASLPEGNRLYVVRICKEDVQEEFAMMSSRLTQFFALVDCIKQDILKTWR